MERFLAFDATQNGKGFNYGDGKTDRYYVEGWKNKEQYLSWQFRSIYPKPQKFKVIIKYLAPAATCGGSYSIILDRNNPVSGKEVYRSEHLVTTDIKSTTVITKVLDNISLEWGTYTLKIAPEIIAKAELMKLLEIQLIPSDK